MSAGPFQDTGRLDPRPVRRADAEELQRRFPGALVWFGSATRQWWAYLPWPTGRQGFQGQPVNHLEELHAALAETRLSSQLRRAEIPMLLRIWHPSMPAVGDSLSVRYGLDGTPWFFSSLGIPVAPCGDVRTARDIVADHMARHLGMVQRT